MSEDLEASLRGGAEKVSEGTFRVDARRALAKLREYRLAEPHAWVLEVLRAANANRATKVQVETDADDVKVRFDGPQIPAAIMQDLLAQALDSKQVGPHRYLSLGVAGALGLGPRWIRVSSGEVAIEIVPPDAVRPLPLKQAEAGTFLHVRKKFGWNVIKASIADTSPEETMVVKHAKAFTAELTHNGKRVNADRFKGGLLALATYTDDEMDVRVGVPVKEKPGQLVFDVGGVVVARKEVELPGRFLVAWARCDGMRRNASGSDLVSSDPLVQRVRDKVDALALTATKTMGELLRGGQLSSAWRKRYREYAIELARAKKKPQAVVDLLAQFPIIPGLYDEWNAPADFEAEKAAGRPIFYTTEVFPRGSYPTPIVKMDTEVNDPLEDLLPEGAKLVDAAKQVRLKVRAAEHRQRWLGSPVEPAELPVDRYSSRAMIDARGLTGEVGLVTKEGAGAFVRLLNKGRFLHHGQVLTLAPLRLRAVVNSDKDIAESTWANMPSDKLLKSVAGAVEKAAEKALLAELGPDVTQRLDPEHVAHAWDYLVRQANAGRPLAALPEGVRKARLLETTDGDRVSLDAIAGLPRWAWVREWTKRGLLSGEPVLILNEEEREALGRLSGKRLDNVWDRIALEKEIRDRIDGPKRPARLDGHRATVDLDEPGMKGQVCVLRTLTPGPNLIVLRDGVPIEQKRIPDFSDLCLAIVDCPDFVPNADWDKVARDATFDRAIAAIRRAIDGLPAALVDHYPFPLAELGTGHAKFLTQFLKKHLVPDGEAHPGAARVAAAPLFRSPSGPISIALIRERIARGATAAYLDADGSSEGLDALTGRLVVFAAPEHAALLSQVLGLPVPDARPEILRALRRQRYRARPSFRADPLATEMLPVTVEGDGVWGTVGFTGKDPGAALMLLVEDRLYTTERFLSNLPLGGVLHLDGVDPADAELPAGARARVHALLPIAEARLVRRALAELDAGGRAVVLRAIALEADRTLPADVSDLMRDAPLFPCTDGTTRTMRMLQGRARVPFVRKAMGGEPASKEPVVIAEDPRVRAALSRWTTEDVTESLQRELDARAARARQPAIENISLGPSAAWRCAIAADGCAGEVGILPAGGGTVQLLKERRVVSALTGVLPAPLAAIVNCDGLSLAAFGEGVVVDGTYDRLVATVRSTAFALLDGVADALFAMDEDQRKAVGALISPLAIWLLEHKQKGARLLKSPVFETTAGNLVSLEVLLAEQKKHSSVLWSFERGTALNESRLIWRPRAVLELEPLKTRLTLKDATPALENAREVRSRKRVERLEAAVKSPWREPLSSSVIEGEVVLREAPTHALVVELHRDRIPLELVTAEHAVGGVACVNADALTPNGDWTRAARNLAFKRAMADVEEALERLLARRLESIDAGWQAYAEAAIAWNPRGGPLAKRIPQLPLFEELRGGDCTVGEAADADARDGRVLVADRGTAAPDDDRLILVRSPEVERLLTQLALKWEDVTPLLKRKVELAEALKARRLSSLRWPGTPIARTPVTGDGFRGELVLLDAHEARELVLAKNGIRVCTRPFDKDLPVGGIVDVDALDVNEDWSGADLPKAVRAALMAFVEPLFLGVAAHAPSMDVAVRPRARQAALAYLAHEGMTSARHLERMKGAAAAVAAAPLFLTEQGIWVGLTAIADQVIRRGWVSVFEQSWRKRDTGDELVLRAPALNDPWISALEGVLGPSCVERVRDVALWRAQLAERDPAPGTPESEGMSRLRKEMRLLRAGALGHVTPDELEDVRLRAGHLKSAIHYDAARKLVLLDGSDPKIKKALEEIPARPERLYVLLAAIYGAVNRALERVTDEDEAELLGALAAHLAANPKCLAPFQPK